MKHKLEQELLNEHQETFNLCINIAYLIDKSGVTTKKVLAEIYMEILKRASAEKMLIDYLKEKDILPVH